MKINNTTELKQALRAGPYAWPGGYPCYFVADDGEALSFDAVRENYKSVLRAVREQDDDGWLVVGIEINYEDQDLYCAHCGKKIESAYGEGQ